MVFARTKTPEFSAKNFFAEIKRDFRGRFSRHSWAEDWNHHCGLLAECTNKEKIRNDIMEIHSHWEQNGRSDSTQMCCIRDVIGILLSVVTNVVVGRDIVEEINASTIFNRLASDMAVVASFSPRSAEWERQWNVVLTDPEYGRYMSGLATDFELRVDTVKLFCDKIEELKATSRQAEHLSYFRQAEPSTDTFLRFWATHHLTNLADAIVQRFHPSVEPDKCLCMAC